ncbi:hypothetical protein APR41_04065 [Salegentibacter salinarum]|uniref:DUF4440 domain-containing protein n=1 Tax=Salegentibacter salinarum TaxID=447422 RepID=A0A2N0TUE7_9FLAO|nr:DUF4440 domain-containing protein [Salegentibacter salinarum]PKD18336.1 hypothetical protein APR41_04065 [Salegentibacter salinarum]SKB44138.1 hypothetical protein SAMN05660903_00830 [Salegentibacter salinarum]
MKRIFQVLIILLTTVTIGQTSEQTKEEKIKDLIENSFQKIFSDMEPKALDTYCTPDFLLLETGEVWDMDKMRNYIKEGGEQKSGVKRINSFDFIEIKIEGKMGWVAYHNKAEFLSGDEVVREINWLESASAILTDEGWKLQLLHSTIAREE